MRRTTRALALAAALSISAVALAGCSSGSLALDKPSPSKTWWSANAGSEATINVKDSVGQAGLSRVLVCSKDPVKVTFTDFGDYEFVDADRPGVTVDGGKAVYEGEGASFKFRPAGATGEKWIVFDIGSSYCS